MKLNYETIEAVLVTAWLAWPLVMVMVDYWKGGAK